MKSDPWRKGSASASSLGNSEGRKLVLSWNAPFNKSAGFVFESQWVQYFFPTRFFPKISPLSFPHFLFPALIYFLFNINLEL